eukprot:Rhum_TRINITY_DN14316_c16_g1::Rhum_TRINITY_DN14316_c16_g1_i1::g.82566::m.82566
MRQRAHASLVPVPQQLLRQPLREHDAAAEGLAEAEDGEGRPLHEQPRRHDPHALHTCLLLQHAHEPEVVEVGGERLRVGGAAARLRRSRDRGGNPVTLESAEARHEQVHGRRVQQGVQVSVGEREVFHTRLAVALDHLHCGGHRGQLLPRLRRRLWLLPSRVVAWREVALSRHACDTGHPRDDARHLFFGGDATLRMHFRHLEDGCEEALALLVPYCADVRDQALVVHPPLYAVRHPSFVHLVRQRHETDPVLVVFGISEANFRSVVLNIVDALVGLFPRGPCCDLRDTSLFFAVHHSLFPCHCLRVCLCLQHCLHLCCPLLNPTQHAHGAPPFLLGLLHLLQLRRKHPRAPVLERHETRAPGHLRHLAHHARRTRRGKVQRHHRRRRSRPRSRRSRAEGTTTVRRRRRRQRRSSSSSRRSLRSKGKKA